MTQILISAPELVKIIQLTLFGIGKDKKLAYSLYLVAYKLIDMFDNSNLGRVYSLFY
jgi:hypothetical protein